MGSSRLKLLLFVSISAVCFKISVQFPACGNNTFFIQYPFKLQQQNPNPHHTTPYDLKCNTQGIVVLNLPFSGEFHVRDIDYFEQRIQLYDPNNCLPKRLKNLSLSSSPFVAVSYQKYTFFSCPLEISQNFTTVPCLSNSTASVVAASEITTVDEIKNITGCRVVYSLQIPVSRVFEHVYDGIDGDIQLAWSDPSSRGGKKSSKPGRLTIFLICAVIISTTLLVALFCLGCGLSIIVVLLDADEANYQSSSSGSTRVWEMAKIRLSRAPRGAAAPLDEVSFVSSTLHQPQQSPLRGVAASLSASPFLPSTLHQPQQSHLRGAAASLNASSSTPPPPPPRVAAVHPFSYYLSFTPSPEVPRGSPAPLDANSGFTSVMPSPEIRSMAAARDESSVISLNQVPSLDEPSSIPLPPPPPPSMDYFLSCMPLPMESPAPLDESHAPSIVSFMPSPQTPSMPATPHEDELFIDAIPHDESSFIISSPQVSRGAVAPLDEYTSALPPPPPPPPPLPLPTSGDEGRPSDYFFSLLSFTAHFRRGGEGAGAPLDEVSSTASSPSVYEDISVVDSPQVPGLAADALEIEDDEFELPTEDIIIGGGECILGPNGDLCIICFGEYKASERVRLIQKCKHCFHAHCLEQWMQRKTTCPICRTNVM